MSRLVLALSLLAVSATAQNPNRHVLPITVGPLVKDAPFSAVRTLDYEPAAGSSDPTPIHQESKEFRDAAGRIRTERHHADGSATIDLVDPAAGTHFRWTVGDKTATRIPLPETAGREVNAIAEHLDADAPKIEGLPTRHTHTNNTERGESVDSWFAPSVRLALLTVIDKPGVGKTTYRFEHLVPGDPDPTLFKLPADLAPVDDAKLAPPPVHHVVDQSSAPAPTPAAAPEASGLQRHPEPVRAAYMDDPKFQKALTQAKTGRQTYEERLDNWKHANKAANNQCGECLHQIIALQLKLSAWKDAVKTAQQLEALNISASESLYAEAERGFALMNFNYGSPKPAELQQAETAFHDVLSKAPRERTVLFSDGRALAMLGRNDEARAAFARYVELTSASDRLHLRAERFADDPHLATQPMAPPFRLVTSEGEEMQLDEMQGKVVLLDFWATWCGPCKESLPEIQRIARDYANDPIFVVISVSQDADASAWKNFVQKNNMTWPQYRDANNALSSSYGVTSIPHFFTIDTNGILKTEKVGSNAEIRSLVDDLVRKAHKAAAQKAREIDKPHTGS